MSPTIQQQQACDKMLYSCCPALRIYFSLRIFMIYIYQIILWSSPPLCMWSLISQSFTFKLPLQSQVHDVHKVLSQSLGHYPALKTSKSEPDKGKVKSTKALRPGPQSRNTLNFFFKSSLNPFLTANDNSPPHFPFLLWRYNMRAFLFIWQLLCKHNKCSLIKT